MVEHYPRLWRLLAGGSILLVLLFSLFPALGQSSLLISSLLILFIGIPHGAADHHLFSRLYRQQYGDKSLYGFYGGYLGLMGLCVLLWWLWPALALVLFLGTSAYHFGQSNFHYLSLEGSQRSWYYWIWGGFVVLAPVLLHFEEARPILEQLLRISLPSISAGSIQFFLLAWGLLIVGLLYRLRAKGVAPRLIARELVSLLALGAVFYALPLLLAFSLYFAAWHALPSAMDQIRFFQQQEKTFPWSSYLKRILPYSLLAILGLALLILGLQTQSVSLNWAIIFAFLSAVTLPHMLVLDRVYHRLEASLNTVKQKKNEEKK